MPSVFLARYDGKCGQCQGRIKKGQKVYYISTKTLAHVRCGVRQVQYEIPKGEISKTPEMTVEQWEQEQARLDWEKKTRTSKR